MFFNNLKMVCDSKGLKITPLVAECGGAKGSITNWRNGATPNSDIVIRLAERLGVTTDRLLLGSDKCTFSDEQDELLSLFNNLSPIDKGKVLGKAEALAELAAERAAKERAAELAEETAKPAAKEQSVEQLKKIMKDHVAEQAEKTAKLVEFAADKDSEINKLDQGTRKKYTIAYYDYPASAGTGLFLGEAIAQKICVSATIQARYADFAIPVNGDSMEPDYSNGDIVLVKCCPNVSVGQVGIFVLDGDVYIKEYSSKCLISHNSKYPPIILKNYETAVCLGRVIGKAEMIK